VKTPLAWHNLVHDRLRTLVALAGVAFAVTLVFLQLGTYGAVLSTATLIYSQLDYDLMLRSPEYLHFSRSGSFPQNRLYQALSLPQVERVVPLYVGYVPWRNPVSLQRRAILTMAFDPQHSAFQSSEIRDQQSRLVASGAVLMDRMSRPEFGTQAVGVETDVGRQTLRVVGLFTMGTGFGADGAIVCGSSTWQRLFPQRPLSRVSLGLVRLEQGVDVEQAAADLIAVLPPDVQVFTRGQIERFEQRHWASRTSIGVILATGLGVAVIVGIAIVYQVLASNVSAHLAEYATLKAMGYRSGTLSGTVMQQALILAVVGFILGTLISQQIYALMRRWAHIPIGMTWTYLLAVLAGSVAMCMIAAIFALRKVYSADPAELF
jgi:putative ABC transport system permease protein